MQRCFFVILFSCFILVDLYSQGNPNRVYQVKYYITNDGDIVADNTTLVTSFNTITVKREDFVRDWECEYKGIKIRKSERNVSFKYHYYLTRDNIKLIISDYKEVKHNGVFYYRIVFNGQTLLAL